MATTEHQTKGKPVSSMTLADLNKRNQQTYDASYAEEIPRGLDPKDQQLRAGTTVHNSRGAVGKVIRVEGSRVIVRKEDGSQDQWDLNKTHEYSGDAEVSNPSGSGKLSEAERNRYFELAKKKTREGVNAMTNKEMEEMAFLAARHHGTKDSEGTEALREGMEEFLEEEEQEPEHQTDALEVRQPNQ